MKIFSFDPKSVCPDLDPSRLGVNTISVTLDELASLAHGIVILGFPDDSGIRNVGGRLGAKEGPRAARQKLYKFTTGKPEIPLYDLGDLAPLDSIEATHRAGASIVRRIHGMGHTPLILGGGHDLAYPEALGFLEANPDRSLGFLNIDAHLDLRPTGAGITSGSPWFLLRENALFQNSKSKLLEFGIQRHCNSQSLEEYAHRHGIAIHWFDAIKNPLKEFRQALNRMARLEAVQISLDIDSVQWSEAPGCSAPQVQGFSAKDAISMSRVAGENKKVKSFGIYELSPPLDNDGKTAQLVAHCIHAFIEARGKYSLTKSSTRIRIKNHVRQDRKKIGRRRNKGS